MRNTAQVPTPDIPRHRTSRFDLLSRFVCVTSLVASLFVGWEICGSIRPGFYGGTALFLALVLAIQFAVLVVAVVVPALVLFYCQRLRMSRIGWWLLTIGVLAIIAEGIVVLIVPVTGSS